MTNLINQHNQGFNQIRIVKIVQILKKYSIRNT